MTNNKSKSQNRPQRFLPPITSEGIELRGLYADYSALASKVRTHCYNARKIGLVNNAPQILAYYGEGFAREVYASAITNADRITLQLKEVLESLRGADGVWESEINAALSKLDQMLPIADRMVKIATEHGRLFSYDD